MKGGKAPLGYTLIEVMIVLAVSSLTFLIAATFISGKQARTQFTQGVNEFASVLQHSIDQVNNGQYTDINVDCTADSTGQVSSVGIGGSTTQGRNTSCVFLGQVYHFSVGTDFATAANHYEVFSLAGGRINDKGDAITTLANMGPKPIAGLTRQEMVPQALNVNYVIVRRADGAVDTSTYGVAFLQSIGTTEKGSLANGSQSVMLYYVPGLTFHKTGGDGGEASALIGAANAANLVPIDEAYICVDDGTRSATITIDTTHGALAVTATPKRGTNCA
jgi:prepilin-type N-terminal cleavage/methylation domain-containing protein